MRDAQRQGRRGGSRAVAVVAACGMTWSAPAVVLAQGGGFPGLFDLGDLDGTNGFALDGAGPEAFFGRRVGLAGDFNNDGVADVIVAAPRESGAGTSYIVFGRRDGFPAVVDVSTLDGFDGLRVNGIDPLDRAGADVNGNIDFNGDGIGDVIISATDADPGGFSEGGEVYVVFGKDVATSEPFPAELFLSALGGDTGTAFTGIDASDRAGRSVASAGDTNGDGVDDLIIGAPGADGAGGDSAGEAYIVYGDDTVAGAWPPSAPLDDLDETTGVVLRGDDPDERAGTSVSSVGDVNGDGVDDVIVGASYNYYAAGVSYVLLGKPDRSAFEVDLGDLDGTDGFALVPPAGVYGRSGQAVAGLGDINGDGLDDFAISAPLEDADGRFSAGVTRVVFGRDDGFPPEINLGSLDGTNGFKIEGALELDTSGSSIASGDVDGDGLIDIVMGAPYGYGDDVLREAGRVYVLFGDDDGFPPIVRLSDLDGTNGFIIQGAGDFDRTGFDVAVGGDIDGDGVDDIVIGNYPAPGYGEERAYVVFGQQVGAPPCPADLDGDGDLTIFDFLEFQNLFASMDPRADFDGDGDFTIFDFLAFQNAFATGCP